MDINNLLNHMVLHRASDLHLSSGIVPMIRVDEDLIPVAGTDFLNASTIKSMLLAILPQPYQIALDNQLDIDLGLGSDKLKARFRINVFHQHRGISVAIRHLPLKPPTLEELGLPVILNKLCEMQNGLILVTGPTGSGKSTTLQL